MTSPGHVCTQLTEAIGTWPSGQPWEHLEEPPGALAQTPAWSEHLQILLSRTFPPGLQGLSEKSLLSLNSYFLANPVARAQPWCNRHLLVVISTPLPKPTYKIMYLAPILSVTLHKKKKNPLKEIKAGAA